MANNNNNKRGSGKGKRLATGVLAGMLAGGIFASGFGGGYAVGKDSNENYEAENDNTTNITETLAEEENSSSSEEESNSSEYAFLTESEAYKIEAEEADKIEAAKNYAEMTIEKLNDLKANAEEANSYPEASGVMDEWVDLITEANQSAVFNTDGLSQEETKILYSMLSQVNEENAELLSQVESGSNGIMSEVYSAYLHGAYSAQVINNEIADVSTIRTIGKAQEYIKNISDAQEFLNGKAEYASGSTVAQTVGVASGPNGSYSSGSISIDGTGTSRFDKCLSDSFKKAIGLDSLSELNAEVRDAFLEDLSQSKALGVAVLQESADDLKNAVIDQDAQKIVDSLLETISFQTIFNQADYNTNGYSADELNNLDAQIADYNNGMYESFVMLANSDELADAARGILSNQDSIYLINQEVDKEVILKFFDEYLSSAQKNSGEEVQQQSNE